MSVDTAPESPAPFLELRLLRTGKQEITADRTSFTTRRNIGTAIGGAVAANDMPPARERRQPENILRVIPTADGLVIPQTRGGEYVLANGSTNALMQTLLQNMQTFFDSVGTLPVQTQGVVRAFHQELAAVLRNERLDNGPAPKNCVTVLEAYEAIQVPIKTLCRNLACGIAELIDKIRDDNRKSTDGFMRSADGIVQREKGMKAPWEMGNWRRLIMEMKTAYAAIQPKTPKLATRPSGSETDILI